MITLGVWSPALLQPFSPSTCRSLTSVWEAIRRLLYFRIWKFLCDSMGYSKISHTMLEYNYIWLMIDTTYIQVFFGQYRYHNGPVTDKSYKSWPYWVNPLQAQPQTRAVSIFLNTHKPYEKCFGCCHHAQTCCAHIMLVVVSCQTNLKLATPGWLCVCTEHWSGICMALMDVPTRCRCFTISQNKHNPYNNIAQTCHRFPPEKWT